MFLSGWKYEGRKISDKLHEQMLAIIEILNDSIKVGDQTWPSLQKYISSELEVAPGQVRTIKRMMEEFGILKRGSLNAKEVPKASNIFTEQGVMLVNLLETEKLMRENPSVNNYELVKEIKSIYQLYYQKVLTDYCYRDEESVLHPLRATLKALKKFGALDYWEWYLLNTVISNDDDINEEKELEEFIDQYRHGKLQFSESDIKENQLSHSYVLGNFVYTGLVCVEGSKTKLKITLNTQFDDVIKEIIN